MFLLKGGAFIRTASSKPILAVHSLLNGRFGLPPLTARLRMRNREVAKGKFVSEGTALRAVSLVLMTGILGLHLAQCLMLATKVPAASASFPIP